MVMVGRWLRKMKDADVKKGGGVSLSSHLGSVVGGWILLNIFVEPCMGVKRLLGKEFFWVAKSLGESGLFCVIAVLRSQAKAF